MLLRIMLFALMAAGLLGFGTVAWISSLPPAPQTAAAPATVTPPSPAPPAPPPTASVTVATHQLRAGSFLKATDIRAAEMPVSQIPPGAILDKPNVWGQLPGSMLRHSIGEGQALVSADVLQPGNHGFLAAVLEPGMRAMTIGLNDVESDWGLLWPGDRIDLILTESFDAAGTLAQRHFASETVLTDARVVAVDQQLLQGATTDDAEHKTAHTLTIEVTPEQAERLAVALRLGKLSISLRSAIPLPGPKTVAGPLPSQMLSDSLNGPVSSRVTWVGDVAHALGQRTRLPEPATVLVFRGNAEAGSRP